MVLFLKFKRMKNIKCDECGLLKTYERKFRENTMYYCKSCVYSLIYSLRKVVGKISLTEGGLLEDG